MRVEYSAAEAHIMALLATSGALTTSQLAKLHYGRKAPKFSRQAMTYTVNSLAEKLKTNRELYRVRSTKRNGPHEKQYWISDANSRRRANQRV